MGQERWQVCLELVRHLLQGKLSLQDELRGLSDFEEVHRPFGDAAS